MNNNQAVNVGLKDKVTNKVVAIFPHSVEGSHEEIKKQVFDWYYKQGCSNEDKLANLYVDVITENDMKNFH